MKESRLLSRHSWDMIGRGQNKISGRDYQKPL